MTQTSKTNVNGRLARRIGLVLALGAAALMVAPATGMAASFGAKLNSTIQPSNSLPAQKCVFGMPAEACTRVEMTTDPGWRQPFEPDIKPA